MRGGEDLGRDGEKVALAHYRSRGFRLVARNWRCRLGELDLVLGARDLIVFCEVKTRRTSRLGGPFEAVNEAKRRKLRALAEAFLADAGLSRCRVRFDVASVTIDGEGLPSIHVFEDAF